MGIKGIIIIADHPVREQAHIQTHLKRADLMLYCICLDQFPVEADFMSQHIVNCFIYPVIVPFGIGTGHRIALRLLQKTDLVPCGQYHRFKQQSFFP